MITKDSFKPEEWLKWEEMTNMLFAWCMSHATWEGQGMVSVSVQEHGIELTDEKHDKYFITWKELGA